MRPSPTRARATKDLDIFVRPSDANAPRVLAALVAFGAPIRQLGIELADFARPNPPSHPDAMSTTYSALAGSSPPTVRG